MKIRTAYALIRNRDGKFHKGTTSKSAFSSVGKLYTASLAHAIDWFAKGSFGRDDEGYPLCYGTPRDMSEYTVVEYLMVEVARTPADVWRQQHGKETK